MDAIAGVAPNGEYWFKSNQYLTNLTHAVHFYVKPPSYVFFWRRRYRLRAKFSVPYRRWSDTYSRYVEDRYTEHKTIGAYRTEASASLALGEVMKILKLKELEDK